MIQYIESSVTAGEDAIIINMVDPETAAQCIEAAGDVPVVFVNRFPGDPSVLNEKAVYVGSDEMTSGAFQGEFLAKFFKDQGKTDISYLMLNGILGQTSTTKPYRICAQGTGGQRHQGNRSRCSAGSRL